MIWKTNSNEKRIDGSSRGEEEEMVGQSEIKNKIKKKEICFYLINF
jgi:hypothetical protein